jgi:hypothetical protein
MQGSNARVRQERVCRLYDGTTLDHVRHGLRLALLSLLDGRVGEQMIALETCRHLAGDDPVLRTKVRQRLLVAVQSGELEEIGRGSDELAAFMIGTLGQWRVAEALPFLQEMARAETFDSASRSRTSEALTHTLEVLGQSVA